MKPKVLVISRDSWNDTNNSGNTLSNLFQCWESDKIANLYFRDEIPNNKVCTQYFKISESLLVRKILRKTKVAGLKFEKRLDETREVDNEIEYQKTEKKLYDFFRNNRWHIFLWARELLWFIGKWKSKELDNFLEEFSPDIIYSPSYDSFYMHSVLYYVQKKTKAKVVYFHCDDLVTYRQYSLSPWYWVNRFVLRKYMNKSIKMADLNYCIIDEQARVYSTIYRSEFKLLYKTGSFRVYPSVKKTILPINIVFTGNIIYGRINSILMLSEVLSIINRDEQKIKLQIYTANLIKDNIKVKLENNKAVELMGKVPYEEIPKILSNSDILLHVESFEKEQMLATSLSFSTKLVDYFEAAKPILAIGWEHSASINYLKENEIGITVSNKEQLHSELLKLIDNTNSLEEYAKKVWDFGNLNHNKNNVLKNFESDLIYLLDKKDYA
ncbi:Glycosyl transferases group 1 [Flavobacterium swingsii]|uniref:Glycosyl transferases group 1 n=1 Tax=Flavobacterium swingsii TaxID=498292 RepID=A0A1I0Z5X2_9FLAO|nr:glycosyltransferase [Flavobacterium swingsii]SFB20812.1 Glycosyl transferases group 1 [Flavobacterium swingsii]